MQCSQHLSAVACGCHSCRALLGTQPACKACSTTAASPVDSADSHLLYHQVLQAAALGSQLT